MAPKTATGPAPVRENRDTPTVEVGAEQLMSLFSKADKEPVTEAPEPPAVPEAEPEAVPEEVPAEVPEGEETPAEEGTEEVPEEPAAPTLYDVAVDGTVEQVTLEQLKAGYSRTADYTRKTQAVARDRERVQADHAQTRQEREQLIAKLREVNQFLAVSQQEPDWIKLANEVEPQEFNRTRAAWDTRHRQMLQLQAEQQELEQREKADRARDAQRQIEDEQRMLYAAIPEWSDAAKAQIEQREIVEYALKAGAPYGVTSLDSITTAFPILVLRKAMLYDRMLAAKPKIVPQKVPTPTAKPGAKVIAPKPSKRQAAFTELVNSGDPKAAEAYFLARLTEAEKAS